MFPQELQTYVACNYFAPCWERSIVMSVYVCLSVHSYTSTTTRLNFMKFSVHVTWAVAQSSSDENGMLCTSGFCG